MASSRDIHIDFTPMDGHHSEIPMVNRWFKKMANRWLIDDWFLIPLGYNWDIDLGTMSIISWFGWHSSDFISQIHIPTIIIWEYIIYPNYIEDIPIYSPYMPNRFPNLWDKMSINLWIWMISGADVRLWWFQRVGLQEISAIFCR